MHHICQLMGTHKASVTQGNFFCDTTCKTMAQCNMQILCYAMQQVLTTQPIKLSLQLLYYPTISFVLPDVKISATSSLPEFISFYAIFRANSIQHLRQMYDCVTSCKKLTVTKMLAIVAKSRTEFYFRQRLRCQHLLHYVA